MSTIRHTHWPWWLSRWTEGSEKKVVVWSLHPAVCPHCPECDGEGGWWIDSPFGDEPDMQQCSRCWLPMVKIRVPGWLDRAIPGSPIRRAVLAAEPPF